MARESISWTALPHGVRGTGADKVILVSVFAAPRLDPDGASGTLEPTAFPQFADWTANVAAATRRRFRLFVRPGEMGTPVVAGIYEARPADLNPQLWRTVVAGIGVGARTTRRLADAPPITYRATPTLDAVRRVYQNAAFSTWYPNVALTGEDPILEGLWAMREVATTGERDRVWHSPSGRAYRLQPPDEALRIATERARSNRDRALDGGYDGPSDGPVLVEALEPLGDHASFDGEPPDPAVELMRARAFYDQHARAAERAVMPPARPGPSQEFHALIGALGAYPDLLRQLGLTFELEVPFADVVAGSGVGYLAVQALWSPGLTAEAFTTWTRTDRGTYWPLVSDDSLSPVRNGYLASATGTTEHLEIVPIELDGTILQLSSIPAVESDAPAPRHLPVVRFGGLGIVRSNHALALHRSAAHALEIDAAFQRGETDYDIAAEDIIRGYRVDVWSERAGAWRSLHAVDRKYELPSDGPNDDGQSWQVATEGFATMTAITPLAPGDDDLQLLLSDEMMLRWRGWSLSATPPGMSRDADGSVFDPATPMHLRNLEIQQKTQPKSLPRLRFGDRYRMRVRTVDLAGNSPPPTGSDPSLPIDADTVVPAKAPHYLAQRFESLEPPVLIPRAKLQEGESIDSLVVRSTRGNDAGDFVRLHPQYRHSHERHVAPPKTTAYTTELHGKLERAFGASATPATVQQVHALASADSGSFDDPVPGSTETILFGPPDQQESYTVHTGERVPLPYLPDPLTGAVVVRNAPGVTNGLWGDAPLTGTLSYSSRPNLPGSVTRVVFGNDATWPAFQPFRLEVAAAGTFQRPMWNAAERFLRIVLPPGEQFTVGLRHGPAESDLTALGVWSWGEERLADLGTLPPGFQDNPVVRKLRATAGDYWFTTPERRLTLVHAVLQPVTAPTMTITAKREPGDTIARLSPKLGIHARSTAKLELTSRWTDRIDPVNHPPQDIELTASVRTQEIVPPASADDWPTPGRETDWTLKGTIQLTAYGAAEGPGSEPSALVSPNGGGLGFAPAPADRRGPTPHEFGDTKHRWVIYKAIATTRFRDYFAPELTADPANITQSSPERRVNVLSSARPAIPRLQTAIPAFRWQTSNPADGSQQRQRHGGVRIYLERPWYSSGDEEKVAVVCWNGSPAWPPPVGAQAFVTRWGRDPIWQTASSAAPGAPRPSDFPARIESATYDDFSGKVPGIDGEGTIPVSIAVHDIAYHDDGRLSCDIQLGPIAGYMPFVRLALARFQPHSVEGLHLSPVVLTDFIQLTPDRQVTLMRAPGDPNRVQLSVSGSVTGQTFDPNGQLLPANTVEVALERRIPGTTDAIGWEPVAPQPVVATSAPGLLWNGQITLPATGAFRIVVREFEFLTADAGAGSTQTRRLVFADTVEL